MIIEGIEVEEIPHVELRTCIGCYFHKNKDKRTDCSLKGINTVQFTCGTNNIVYKRIYSEKHKRKKLNI